MAGRSQPYRLKWPLTASEVESLDDMLERLFKRVTALENADALATATGSGSGTSTSSLVGSGILGPRGRAGEDGRRGFPGPSQTVLSAFESRVILDGETRTILDTYDRIYVDYLSIAGSGALVIEGDGVLAII